MTARADDTIIWAPPNERLGKLGHTPLVHRCPTAIIAVACARQSLDPMALGSCRYCGAKLP